MYYTIKYEKYMLSKLFEFDKINKKLFKDIYISVLYYITYVSF
jgi:hypothetical protein